MGSTLADPAPEQLLVLLAEPLRWRLLQELGRSDRRVGELVEAVGKPQNLVSYHLGLLRRAGLVTARRSSYDGRDTYYRVDLDRCARSLAATATALAPGLALAAPLGPPPGRVAGRPPRVLFLCTGNSARSQLAEALARQRAGGTVEIRSAGSHPKPVHPEVARVLAERGIDGSHLASKHVRRFGRMRFDRIVTLCDRVREVCPELPGDPVRVHWSIADPALAATDGGDLSAAFDQTARYLEGRIPHLLADLAATAATREPTHA